MVIKHFTELEVLMVGRIGMIGNSDGRNDWEAGLGGETNCLVKIVKFRHMLSNSRLSDQSFKSSIVISRLVMLQWRAFLGAANSSLRFQRQSQTMSLYSVRQQKLLFSWHTEWVQGLVWAEWRLKMRQTNELVLQM